ncbi:MaoC/PaaZ C-terminal domain-containing protein [Pseudonocardia kujensis]|uniref:MaoC/PaaZ C-terminal domain-containing protein n=1 Tax=Pseudonocardia kujensis TaxID=1128675 RepID=UPI0022B80230|nr:MaoC/PaaZ C-terminal domain-containing protein [Pseudonocardia kujensis]
MELQVGESRTAAVVEDLSRTRIAMYAGASGDFNPLHTDEVYATRVAGQPTVLAHGMLAMGASGKVVTDWVGIGALRSFGGRFVRPVRPGDTLTARATVEAVQVLEGRQLAELAVETTDQNGRTVLTGRATADLGPA